MKLKENFFQDKTIKKLRKIAGGDTYTVIYLKLMLLGLKDGGKLFFDGVENSFHEELALEIDEDSENVKFTLMFLEKTGLLEEINESELFLTRMPEMIGSETDKAELMRRKRAQNRVQSGNNVTVALPGVTLCYTEIEKDKEIDTEIEREKDGTADEPPAPPRPPVPYEAIKDFYNLTCSSFPRCTTMSESRKKAIKARFTSGYTLEDFKKVFVKAEGSSFLKGRNDRNWTATFDWMIKDGNMAKILEGNYDDHDMGPGPGPRPAGGGRNNTGFQTSNPFLEMLREERDKQ